MSTQWVSDRISGLVPSATIAIGDRIRRLREAGHEITNLISGAPEFDTPAAKFLTALLPSRCAVAPVPPAGYS